MSTLPRIALLLAVSSLLDCNNNPGHYEDITRVRGIGAVTSPNVAAPSTATTTNTITVTFLAAAPLGAIITPTVVSDPEGVGPGTAATMTLVSGTSKTTNHAALLIYQVNATITVPPADQLQFIGSDHVASLHYALQLTSPNYPTEIMVGNALIFAPGASQLNTLNGYPTIKISAPANGATVGNSAQTINANLTQGANSESFRIGWFTNSGDIDNSNVPAQNRNATTTQWDPSGTGKFTLIVTTRGATSGAFAYDVSDVTVQ